MDVTDQDVTNVRRISEELFGDREHIAIKKVEETNGDVMVEVESEGGGLDTRNAFAGMNLTEYHDNGYVAVSVGGGGDRHSAWFVSADSIDFGEPGPSGEYDLMNKWTATVGDKLVLRYDGSVINHISRDGWTLDTYVLHKVIPAQVRRSLLDAGFEESEEPLN